MKCPACRSLIVAASQTCPTCTVHFDPRLQQKLSLYFVLRKKWDDLMATSEGLSRQIRDLGATINAYEEEINLDIATIALSYEEMKAVGKPDASRPMAAGQPSQASSVGRPETAAHAQAIPPDSPRPVPAMSHAPKSHKGGVDQEFKIGQKWLLIIGIVTMVFGVAFFLKYSFDQGWVGPAGRVSLAFLWGLAFLTAGHVIRKRSFPAFGLPVSGGGIAVLYFATYAGFQIYHLFPQELSFGLMILITVLSCAMAVAYETQALAVLGLVGGFLTPVLLSTGQDNYLVLFSYMTLLNLGVLAVAFKKRWTLLQQIGFVLTYFLYISWYADRYTPGKFWAAVSFLNVFSLIYSVIPFAYHFAKRERHDMKGFYILLPNSIVAFAFNFVMIKEAFSVEWVSVVTVFYALLFLVFAHVLYRQGEKQREALVIMLMKSSLFLIVSVPLLFSREWITVFWTVQAIMLLLGAGKLGRKSFLFASYGLMVLALGKFLIYDLTSVFTYDLRPDGLFVARSFGYLLWERWFTAATLLVSLFGFGTVARKEITRGSALFSGGEVLAPGVFNVFFGGLLFLIVTLETSAFFHDYLAAALFAAISVVWALFAIVLMILGFRQNSGNTRKIALGLIFLTLFKVFFFDINNISTPYRILSFIVLGLILILVSYLYNRASARLLQPEHVQEGVEHDK